MVLFMMIATPVFATGITATDGAANPATCDTNVLGTDTGPANLRAEFTPENINLKWYNGDTRINVANPSNSCTYDTPISLPANPTRPGYTFKGWKAIPGTRIQYIEATGTQWINTGINPANYPNFKWQIDFTYKSPYAYNYSGHGVARWIKFDIKSSTKIGIQGNTDYTETILNVVPTERHVYMLSATGTCAVDGQSYSLDYTPDVSSGNISLFKVYADTTSAGTMTGGYLYSSKMWNGSVLIRDMIPIKDTNGVACMYDFVSKQIFYNAGTGDFIAGPDL